MGKIYQLKITLSNTKPLIWRRAEVEDCTLYRLHKVIQVCMGWRDYHPWSFTVGGLEYGDDEEDEFGEREFERARKTKFSQFVTMGIKKFHYVYDFGDIWKHWVHVESIGVAVPRTTYPRCIGGERACPPEDCGGTGGYLDFLKIIRNPKHKEYKETLFWAGGQFDPEKFDLDAVNAKLAKMRRWRRG